MFTLVTGLLSVTDSKAYMSRKSTPKAHARTPARTYIHTYIENKRFLRDKNKYSILETIFKLNTINLH